jgi:mutator protein MutT
MAIFYYKDNKAPCPNLPMSVGCVAVIRNGKEILIEHRNDSERWAFIGGKMEPDEDAETAIVREIKEETNLDVKKTRLLNVFSDPSRIIEYPDGNSKRIVTILFEVEVQDFSHIICSEESRELKFLTVDELSKKQIAETHIPIFNYIKYL